MTPESPLGSPLGSPLDRPAAVKGKRISVVLAIAIHLLLAAFLYYGVRWQSKPGEAVEVELVRSLPEPAAVPPAPTFEPPPPKPPVKIEPEPKPEPKPIAKPEIAIKEKEKPKPPLKPEPKPEPPPQTKPPIKPLPTPTAKPEPPPPDPFQEQLKRDSEQLATRKAMDSELSKLTAAKEAQAKAKSAKAIADYLAKIRGKIRGNIVVPPDVRGNPEAIFEVTQLPGGEIVDVKLKNSSGHAALDSAIERAIRKSSPLPKPDQSDLFDRRLVLQFRPLEE